MKFEKDQKQVSDEFKKNINPVFVSIIFSMKSLTKEKVYLKYSK